MAMMRLTREDFQHAISEARKNREEEETECVQSEDKGCDTNLELDDDIPF